MGAKRISLRLSAGALGGLAAYAAAAYLIAPVFWRHHERQPGLAAY